VRIGRAGALPDATVTSEERSGNLSRQASGRARVIRGWIRIEDENAVVAMQKLRV
jgi:hypothetical protein